MIRRMNYTERHKIKSEHIGFTIRDISGSHPVATASISLDEYNLPDDAEVVFEAYRRATYQRVPVGTVEQLLDKHEFELSEFDTADGVLFRAKVIGRNSDLNHDAPLLLAVADRVAPQEGDEEDADRDKLIRFVPYDLNGEIWRLDFEDGPTVLLERSYWENRSQIVRSGWFFSLVLPEIFRRALHEALEGNYRDINDDDWRSKWLRFALSIPGDSELPDDNEDHVNNWVTSKVAAFCRQNDMEERFGRAAQLGGA